MANTDIPNQYIEEDKAQAELLSEGQEITQQLNEALDLPEQTAEEYEQKSKTLEARIADGHSVKANLEIGSPEHRELVTALYAAERELVILQEHEKLVQLSREMPDVDPGILPASYA